VAAVQYKSASLRFWILLLGVWGVLWLGFFGCFSFLDEQRGGQKGYNFILHIADHQITLHYKTEMQKLKRLSS